MTTDNRAGNVVGFSIDEISEEEFVQLADAVANLARVMADTFAAAFEQLVVVFRELADALLPYVEYMPGPEFRRFRKARQLREHRERVAARTPAWKRAD